MCIPVYMLKQSYIQHTYKDWKDMLVSKTAVSSEDASVTRALLATAIKCSYVQYTYIDFQHVDNIVSGLLAFIGAV